MPNWLAGATEVDHVVASAVELALDVAYHDGEPRDLAVAAEAWGQLGFHDGAVMVTHASPSETLARVTLARRGRPRRLLRADARGMVAAFYLLAQAGQLNARDLREAAHRRWVERGGNDRPSPGPARFDSRATGVPQSGEPM